MDATKRQITKIAREVSKFTVRTMRREGVGSGEFDVIHAIRKNPGITQAGVCEITGLDKGAVARQIAERTPPTAAAGCFSPRRRRSG